MKAWIIGFAFVLLPLPLPALGNGAISEFPAGGVQFLQSADIAIEREDLYLSLEQVRVHYDYRSDAAGTQHVTIGFPMPAVPIDGGPDQLGGAINIDAGDPLNYMLFKASVNGVPVETTLHEYAWFKGENITEELNKAGVPLYLPYDETNERLAGVDQKTIADMIARGLIVPTGLGDLGGPLWQYQAVYEWEQDFAPGITQVDISYVPLTGYPGDIFDYYEVDPDRVYCVDDGVRAVINDYRGRGVAYEVQTLSYILTTAQYWKGPIGEFNLTVQKEQPDPVNGIAGTVLAFCGMRDAVETEKDFRLSQRDFAPKNDISVVWYAFYDFSGTEEGEAPAE
ncbi:MAG: DUF4424 family protein [Devosia sp.]